MGGVPEAIIRVRDLVVGFGRQRVLDGLSLGVHRGEILGLVGGSGSGKSVLLRTIIGLIPRRHGSIEVLGVDLGHAGDEARRAIERRWGILFQHGALFSSLTARENVEFPMREYLDVSDRLRGEVATLPRTYRSGPPWPVPASSVKDDARRHGRPPGPGRSDAGSRARRPPGRPRPRRAGRCVRPPRPS